MKTDVISLMSGRFVVLCPELDSGSFPIMVGLRTGVRVLVSDNLDFSLLNVGRVLCEQVFQLNMTSVSVKESECTLD